MLINNELLEI